MDTATIGLACVIAMGVVGIIYVLITNIGHEPGDW